PFRGDHGVDPGDRVVEAGVDAGVPAVIEPHRQASERARNEHQQPRPVQGHRVRPRARRLQRTDQPALHGCTSACKVNVAYTTAPTTPTTTPKPNTASSLTRLSDRATPPTRRVPDPHRTSRAAPATRDAGTAGRSSVGPRTPGTARCRLGCTGRTRRCG